MSFFDFSSAEVVDWELPFRPIVSFMMNASWRQGDFLLLAYTMRRGRPPERIFELFRVTCRPIFALLVQDEVCGLSIYNRGGPNHIIVKNSEWVESFTKTEPYGNSHDKREMIHYVLCFGKDFAHLLTKDAPKVVSLGEFVETDLHKFDLPPRCEN